MRQSKGISVLLLLVLSVALIYGNDSPAQSVRKVAIFTANRAGKNMDSKLGALEDFVTGHITDKGFSVISREVATDALSSLYGKETDLDKVLSDSTSALRLAQNLGADYILLASISSFGNTEKTTTIGGKEITQTIYTLRLTYKLTEGVQGGTVASATVPVSEPIFKTPDTQVNDSDLVNRLLDEGASQVAENVGQKAIAAVTAKPSLVEFSVACAIADAAGQSVSIPDVRMDKDHRVTVEKTPLEAQAVAVDVDLDGTTIGSAPDVFHAAPGLHKMRLTHAQCKPWEKTVNISQGQRFREVLEMTDEAYQRWKDQTAFLQGLENGKKLTDAEVERIKGVAAFFKNSKYAIDIQGKPGSVYLAEISHN
jgi:hypothetical protein